MFPAEIIGPDLIIIIVVGVIVLLFGGSKLPKLARGLGSASHEFKKGLSEGAEGGDANQVESAQASAIPPQVQAAPPAPAPQAPPQQPSYQQPSYPQQQPYQPPTEQQPYQQPVEQQPQGYQQPQS